MEKIGIVFIVGFLLEVIMPSLDNLKIFPMDSKSMGI